MSRRVLAGGLQVLGGSVLQGLVRLAAAALVARLAGPERQGTFALALTCINIGAVVLGLGLDYANMYVLGARPESAGVIASNSLVVGVAAGLMGVVWSTGFALLVPSGLDPSASSVVQVFLLALGIGALAIQQAGHSLAIGLRRPVALGFAGLTGACIWLATAKYFSDQGIVPLLVGWVVSAAIAPAILLGGEIRHYGFVFDRVTMVEQLRYGLRTIPAAIFRSLNLRLTLFLTAAFLPISEVGIYALVLSLAEAVLLIPSALGQVALVAVAGQHDPSAETPMPLYLAAMALPLVAASVVAIAGEAGLAFLAGPRYSAGSGAFAVLLLAAAFHGVGLIRLHVIMGLGHPEAAGRAQGIALVVTATAGVVLVPRFGMLGAAMTTLLTYAVFAVYLLTARVSMRR